MVPRAGRPYVEAARGGRTPVRRVPRVGKAESQAGERPMELIIRPQVYAITPYRGGVSGLWDLEQQIGIWYPLGINLGFGIYQPARRTWD